MAAGDLTQPISSAVYTAGPVGLGLQLGTTYKLPARGEAQGASDGADVKITNLLNELDRRMALGWNGINGLLMSNNGADSDHDIDIAVGWCMDSTRAQGIYLGSSLTKRIDANWSAGSGNGGFASALTLSADTWYHVFLILNVDADAGTYTVDAGFDTSTSATNLLSDASTYDYYRRIGSVLTDATSNIIAFDMAELHGARMVLWKSPPQLDADTSSQGASAASYTLSVPPDVRMLALLSVICGKSSVQITAVLRNPDATDVAPSGTAAPLANIGNDGGGPSLGQVAQLQVLTNTSRQIEARSSAASTTLRVATEGWLEAA